jgi:cytochrome c
MLWNMLLCLVVLGVVGTSAHAQSAHAQSAHAQSAHAQFAHAQFALPVASRPPSGEAVFHSQCGTCHTLSAQEPMRQGPPLGGVFGRKAGGAPGFRYSAGFADADFEWDAERLDAWLTRPQAVIPGAVMGYRQGNPAIRRAVIDWLKEQH